MRKALRFTDGKHTITLDGGLHDMVEKAIRESNGVLLDAMEQEVKGLFQAAYDEWPVKTGKSRDALAWDIRVSTDTVRGVVFNTADYVYYIKALKHGAKQTWKVLIKDPAEEVGERLADVVTNRLTDKIT